MCGIRQAERDHANETRTSFSFKFCGSPVGLGALHDPSQELDPVDARERVVEVGLAGEHVGQALVRVVLPVDELVRSAMTR